RLYFMANGVEVFHILSKGGKDINQRAMLNRQDIRRMLGVSTASREKQGTAGQKAYRRSGQEPNSPIPRITIKPNPLDALAPLKERLEEQMEQFRENPYGVASFKMLSTEVVKVTPELARSLNKNCHFERQRPMNMAHVKRLAD